MRRFCTRLPLTLLLLLGGCRIEQTPTRFIDQLETPEAEIQASAEELTDRLLSTAPALERGDLRSVLTALTPHAELTAFTPASDSAVVSGAGLGAALRDLASGRESVAADGVVVDVGPGNDVAWFRASYQLVPPDTASTDAAAALPERLHFTGVFIRLEGEWRLRQAHLSAAVTPAPTAPDPAARADTLAEAG